MVMSRSLTVPASQQTKSSFLTELQSKETTEASGVRGNKCSDPKHVQEEINQPPKQASIPIQKHTLKMPTLNPWQGPVGLVNSTSYCLSGLHYMSQAQPVLPPALPGWQGHFRLTPFFQWRSMNSLYRVLVSKAGIHSCAAVKKYLAKQLLSWGRERQGSWNGTAKQTMEMFSYAWS